MSYLDQSRFSAHGSLGENEEESNLLFPVACYGVPPLEKGVRGIFNSGSCSVSDRDRGFRAGTILIVHEAIE